MAKNESKIEDYISGIEVSATPEEIEAVQVFSIQLVEDYGYDKNQIQTRPQFRVKARPSDTRKEYPVYIAVFSKNSKNDNDLLIIVECKKKNRKDGESQLEDYLRLSKAEIGVWFNGNEKVTDSDPVPDDPNAKSLDASDPKILCSIIGENEIHLYKSEEQHLNWLECIKSGKQPISPIEIGHRACTICLITHIAMKVPGILKWDPVKERFLNSDTANKMLSRAQTSPYGINAIVNKY